MSFEAPTWWPPMVGDKLYCLTRYSSSVISIPDVIVLYHVVSVFEHEGETRAVLAEWFSYRQRWEYKIISSITISASPSVHEQWWWRDGDDPPQAIEIRS